MQTSRTHTYIASEMVNTSGLANFFFFLFCSFTCFLLNYHSHGPLSRIFNPQTDYRNNISGATSRQDRVPGRSVETWGYHYAGQTTQEVEEKHFYRTNNHGINIGMSQQPSILLLALLLSW